MKNKQQEIRALLDQLDSSDYYIRSVKQQISMYLDNLNEEVENYELFKKNEFLSLIVGKEDEVAKMLGETREVIDKKIMSSTFTNGEVRFILYHFLIYKKEIRI